MRNKRFKFPWKFHGRPRRMQHGKMTESRSGTRIKIARERMTKFILRRDRAKGRRSSDGGQLGRPGAQRGPGNPRGKVPAPCAMPSAGPLSLTRPSATCGGARWARWELRLASDWSAHPTYFGSFIFFFFTKYLN